MYVSNLSLEIALEAGARLTRVVIEDDAEDALSEPMADSGGGSCDEAACLFRQSSQDPIA